MTLAARLYCSSEAGVACFGVGQQPLDLFAGQPGQNGDTRDWGFSPFDATLVAGDFNICLLGEFEEGFRREAVPEKDTD